ncbi:GNAT family N-acetyltransferase [Aurantiacibacter flavus]|uniref:GNAT family N-acetyltransferase n=1 Tax=Aurantiacibacter flavus TaxID=3145232 RepID=A0ABV0CU38_9SPHN
MQIAQAGIDDLDLLVPLFESYRAFYGGQPQPEKARNFLRERMERSQSVVLLAREGEEAGGFVQLYPLFSSAAMADVLVLNDLFVAPKHRRKGLAARLVKAAEEYAVGQGVSRLRLSTQHSNTCAQALYEAAGWELDREFRTYNRAL